MIVVMREMGYRGAMGQFMVLGGLSMAAKKIYGAITGVTQDIMHALQTMLHQIFKEMQT